MVSKAQELRDTVARTVAIGAAVTLEAAAVKAEASQAAQANQIADGGGNGEPRSDRA